MTTPPVIGAALTVETLPQFRDWLFEKDRDIELQSFHAPRLLMGDGWKAPAEAARAALAGYRGRIGIHGPFCGLHLANPDPEIRAIIRRRMDTGLDICGTVGATLMVVHSPFTTWDHNNLDNRAGSRERMIETVHDSLGDAVRRAEDMGVTLALENIEDVDPAERLRLADSFDSPAIGVSLDTGHAMYAHGSTGAPPVDYYVALAGERLHHVHLQDADGHADRHWSIGHGAVPWHAVFRALGRLSARPRLILELADHGDIPASMAWLEAQGLGQ